MAGQFSRLSQSLTPKIRTGKKIRNNSNPHIVYNPSATAIEQGIEHADLHADLGKPGDESSDSDENDCSIYEPDHSDLVEQNPIYNEDAFIPGVGIVMAPAEIHAGTEPNARADMRKLSVDVGTTLCKPATSSQSVGTAPKTHIHEIDGAKRLTDSGGHKLSQSAIEVRIDASSASESRCVCNLQLMTARHTWCHADQYPIAVDLSPTLNLTLSRSRSLARLQLSTTQGFGTQSDFVAE